MAGRCVCNRNPGRERDFPFRKNILRLLIPSISASFPKGVRPLNAGDLKDCNAIHNSM